MLVAVQARRGGVGLNRAGGRDSADKTVFVVIVLDGPTWIGRVELSTRGRPETGADLSARTGRDEHIRPNGLGRH